MLYTRYLPVAACLYLLPTSVFAQTLSNEPCPILNLNYPKIQRYGADPIVLTAVGNLQNAITSILNGSSRQPSFNYSTTAFSVELYSLHDEKSLFTYHFTPDAVKTRRTAGVETVDSNTVYRIGSISKLYTVYLYLIAAGDATWNQPITNFVPELAAYAAKTRASYSSSSIDIVDWSSITIGALASQMAGIPRDGAFSGALENALVSVGVPSPARNKTSFCGDDIRARISCNRTAFFEDFVLQHPITTSSTTPIYSNAAFQILAYAIANITGTSVSDLLKTSLIQPLNLNSTFYTIPPNPNSSFIPGNATTSWYNADALDVSPTGGYFSSINDMRAIGKSMLNSTFLSPALTQRWMKPHAFTSNVNFSVGAPWEIRRGPGKPVSWLYTKSGDFGAYSSMTALLPEYNVGFSVLAAGGDPNSAARVLSGLLAAYAVPAVHDAGKAAAMAGYAGTYRDVATNSTIVLATDEYEGLVIRDWTLAGRQVLPLLGSLRGVNPKSQNMTGRLYYSGLKGMNGTMVGWRAVYEALPRVKDDRPFEANCATWGSVDALTYGGVGLDEFAFTLDANGSAAVIVQPRFVGRQLLKGGPGGGTARMLRV